MLTGMRAISWQLVGGGLSKAFLTLVGMTAIAILAPFAAAVELPSLPAPAALTSPAQTNLTTELSQAAACIERGDEADAIVILTRHLEAHPTHTTIRAYLAEIHFRRGDWQAARMEFDRFVAEAQLADLETPRLVHAHTRLMAVAEKLKDKYSEHLHRGIGLYLLGRQASATDSGAAERYWCGAAGELARAERIAQGLARAQWYRYRVWQQLGQTAAARTALRAAIRDASFSDLTSAEKLDLSVARDAEFLHAH